MYHIAHARTRPPLALLSTRLVKIILASLSSARRAQDMASPHSSTSPPPFSPAAAWTKLVCLRPRTRGSRQNGLSWPLSGGCGLPSCPASSEIVRDVHIST